MEYSANTRYAYTQSIHGRRVTYEEAVVWMETGVTVDEMNVIKIIYRNIV